MPTAKPPEGLAFDRIPTPVGEALVMWDAAGLLESSTGAAMSRACSACSRAIMAR